ncbi:MAG: dTDP-glucose 4,6-dehydratase [Candidatus Dormibacteria bacterium]
MDKVMVTGGNGFIGSNFIHHMVKKYPSIKILNIDCLTYAACPKALDDVHQVETIQYDIASTSGNLERLVDQFEPEWVVHFAAESHVDNSIKNPNAFFRTNVEGTLNLLNVLVGARHKPWLLHISTDEVYGSLALGDDPDNKDSFAEHDPIEPNSPYAASKAAAEAFVHAYGATFQLPYIISRSSNNYGPFQHPEKFISKTITNALQDKPIPVYGQGINERDWIYVEENCQALSTLIEYGLPGDVYNIGGNRAVNNLFVVKTILAILEKPESLIKFVADRPGHDLKYKVSTYKMETLGWFPQMAMLNGLEKTCRWFRDNEWFWRKA